VSVEQPVFQAIKARRVSRSFTSDPIPRDILVQLLTAARWAPSAGNRRIHKFIVVEQQQTIQLIRSVSPGMLAHPTALIVICTDKVKATEEEGVKLALDSTTWIDVGAAAQNMMLAAHELGLGACPTTSFSHSGVGTILNLPARLEPEYILQLGHPVSESRVMRAGVTTRLKVEDISYWGAFPEGS
jgi:nitroreductase